MRHCWSRTFVRNLLLDFIKGRKKNVIENQLVKGTGYWFIENLIDHKIAVYFGRLSNTINKLDVLMRTSQDFLKTYMFSVEDFDGKIKTIPIYSKSLIYNSHNEILDYCRVNKMTILYSVSAIKYLVESCQLSFIVWNKMRKSSIDKSAPLICPSRHISNNRRC